ncbi:hypothetical protein [Pontimicrobium sp. MEBiC01747]
MKPIFKIKKLRNRPFLPLSIVLVFLIVILLFTSCQDEVTEITGPDQQEIIVPNSNLANLMQKTVSMDGSVDNIIDNASCLAIELPVTVSVNGVEIIIDSEADYDVIEAIFDEFGTDEDTLEIIFPITIILSDYSEIEINNNDELVEFIEECAGENEEDDDIECIDFQYPVTLSLYNTGFEVIETVTIENDEALYSFIENLDGSVLASLNFPITLILNDGSIVEVNNNQELQQVIEAAENTCDEDDDNDWNDDDDDACTEEFVELALKECIWNIVSYNGDDVFVNYNIDFNANYEFTITSNGVVIHDGTWSVSENNNTVTVDLETSFQDIAGSWVVEECQIDRFELENETGAGTIEIIMERDCETNTNPFECFSSFNATIAECDVDGDGVAEFNLTEAFSNCIVPAIHNVMYYETLADAQSETNAIPNPTIYTNTIVSYQTIYARVEVISNTNTSFEVFEIELIVENCTTTCDELAVDDYLQTCIWNVVNYNNSDDLIIFALDFNDDGTLVINGDGQTITAMWSTSVTSAGVWVEFTGVNGANIQAITGNWLVIECAEDRLEMTKDSNTMVLEQTCN